MKDTGGTFEEKNAKSRANIAIYNGWKKQAEEEYKILLNGLNELIRKEELKLTD